MKCHLHSLQVVKHKLSFAVLQIRISLINECYCCSDFMLLCIYRRYQKITFNISYNKMTFSCPKHFVSLFSSELLYCYFNQSSNLIQKDFYKVSFLHNYFVSLVPVIPTCRYFLIQEMMMNMLMLVWLMSHMPSGICTSMEENSV